jgi:hypothetical protein
MSHRSIEATLEVNLFLLADVHHLPSDLYVDQTSVHRNLHLFKLSIQSVHGDFEFIEFFSCFGHQLEIGLNLLQDTMEGRSLPFLEVILRLMVSVSLTSVSLPVDSYLSEWIWEWLDVHMK